MIRHHRPTVTRRARPRVESLENRALLATGFAEFPLPTAPTAQFVQVHDIVATGDNQVEVALTRNGPADPITGQPTYEGTSLDQVTTSGAISALHPEGDSTRSSIFGLVLGSDGNLWGIVNYAPARLNADGTLTTFPLPAGSYAQAIAPAPDGSLYFTEPYHAPADGDPAGSFRQAIGRITTSGQISESLLPANAAQPDQIVAGPDHAIWFTLNDFGAGAATPAIGRISSLGVVTEYALPNTSVLPNAITTGPDGNLWFTAQGIGKHSNLTVNTGSNYVGTITTAGQITLFPLNPQAENQQAGDVLGGITAGPDGNVWFTEPKSGQLARITPNGSVTEFPVPTVTSAPTDITLGHDGALWFTEQLGNQVGRYLPAATPPATPLPAATLSATIDSLPPNAGTTYNGIVGSFTDNSSNPASAYQATIDWGDGSAASVGNLVNTGTRFEVADGHVYASPGTYAVTLMVHGPSGESAAVAGSLVVHAAHAGSGRFNQAAKHSPLRLALSYDGALNPALAGNLSRYSAVSLGRVNRHGVQATRAIHLTAATYDSSTNTVFLTTRGTVSRRMPVRVTIAGEGTVTIPPG